MLPVASGLPIISHMFGFVWKMYSRLNQLEQLLAPSLAVGYKPLFDGPDVSHTGLKIGALLLIVIALLWNSFETKQRFAQGHQNPLHILEPLLKASGWCFIFIQILHHIRSLSG